jgi:hypothetical protein
VEVKKVLRCQSLSFFDKFDDIINKDGVGADE